MEKEMGTSAVFLPRESHAQREHRRATVRGLQVRYNLATGSSDTGNLEANKVEH